MTDTDYKKVFGFVQGVNLGQTSDKKTFFKIMIDGKQYNWFTEGCELKIGDYVEGLFFETPNPKNTASPYKNVKSLEVTEPPSPPEVPPIPELFLKQGKQIFEIASISAAILTAATLSKENDPEGWLDVMINNNLYDKLVVSLYNRLKTLSDKLELRKQD